jgi:hypothetical protein
VPAGTASTAVSGADTGAAGVPAVADEAPRRDAAPPSVPVPAAEPAQGADAGTDPGTMVLPAFADATATFPATSEPLVSDAGPATAATEAQPEVAGDEQPAPPTRRSVRSAPVDPRTRRG